MEELARRRIAEDEDRVAFLYVDGRVREYHGKFPLFAAKKAQRKVVTPAAADTWVHDVEGELLLVVTSEMNAKLTQVLEPILADVRRLVGGQRRMTVIFDRGGFAKSSRLRLRPIKPLAASPSRRLEKGNNIWYDHRLSDSGGVAQLVRAAES